MVTVISPPPSRIIDTTARISNFITHMMAGAVPMLCGAVIFLIQCSPLLSALELWQVGQRGVRVQLEGGGEVWRGRGAGQAS